MTRAPIYEPDEAFLRQFGALPDAEANRLVLDELDRWERNQYHDSDELLKLAMTIVKAGERGVQAAVEEWLDLHPTAAGYETAGWLMDGLWLKLEPRPSLVAKLMAALPLMEGNRGALHALLLSLTSAAWYIALDGREDLLKLLRQYYQRKDELRLDEGAVEALQEAIETR
jgi:hypothetical protein